MPLDTINDEPDHITLEEYEDLQQSTPSTFQNQSPILRLKLENVQCYLQPINVISGWDETIEGQNDNGSSSSIKTGTLYITDNSLSFLITNGNGFSLDYPSLSLHAISRSLPQALSGRAGSENSGCIYCQIDLEGDQEAEEETEQEEGLAELWLLPATQEQVEPLFESLSFCASLHPSTIGEGEDEGLGNPFSSIGAFGTGLMSTNGNTEAFEDAEEEGEGPASGVNLSDSGRATLARLDGLVQWPENGEENVTIQNPTLESKQDEIEKATLSNPTKALILTHLPDEVFHHPELASALLDLLYAYGEMEWWLTLPAFGRAIVMYKETEGAQRAKEALDRLLLPLLDEGEDENESTGEVELLKSSKEDRESTTLRAYFGDPQALSRLRDEGEQRLPVPSTDRNFLISPPGSPPVGWEPIREDPPNTNTLADDLIRALGSLRDRGLGVRSHTPEPLEGEGEDERKKGSHRRTASSSSLAPPPTSIIIQPRQTATLSHHPLAKAAYEDSDQDRFGDNENENISLPGVTVQNYDIEEDKANARDGLDTQMNKGLSINSVKATVESMRGAPASMDSLGSTTAKITPTARPPLG